MGILQVRDIIGIHDSTGDGYGLQIRYKLVETDAHSAAETRPAPPADPLSDADQRVLLKQYDKRLNEYNNTVNDLIEAMKEYAIELGSRNDASPEVRARSAESLTVKVQTLEKRRVELGAKIEQVMKQEADDTPAPMPPQAADAANHPVFPWLDVRRTAPSKPWDELLAAAKNASRPDSPESQLAMLRELQLALDAHPPRGAELLVRNEMTHAMSGGFSNRMTYEAIAWLTETLDRFKDTPTATGVLQAKVRLAELFHVTQDGDGERYRVLFTQLLMEVLNTPPEKVLTETKDGRILSAEEIQTAEVPPGWQPRTAVQPGPDAKEQSAKLYRAVVESDRLDRFKQSHAAAAQVLARAQWVKDRPDLTRGTLLKLQADRKDDADYQRAIADYLVEIEAVIAKAPPRQNR